MKIERGPRKPRGGPEKNFGALGPPLEKKFNPPLNSALHVFNTFLNIEQRILYSRCPSSIVFYPTSIFSAQNVAVNCYPFFSFSRTRFLFKNFHSKFFKNISSVVELIRRRAWIRHFPFSCSRCRRRGRDRPRRRELQ